jgi:hypothetical protein
MATGGSHFVPALSSNRFNTQTLNPVKKLNPPIYFVNNRDEQFDGLLLANHMKLVFNENRNVLHPAT